MVLHQTVIKQIKSIDPIFVGLFIFLTIVGWVMIYSASSVLAEQTMRNSYHYLNRQLLFTAIGCVAFLVCFFTPPEFFANHAGKLLLASLLITSLLVVPGMGVSRGGAVRWLRVAGIQFQPSEFLKFAMIIFLSARLSRKRAHALQSFKTGFVSFAFLLGICTLLFQLQSDFGSVVTLALVTFAIMYIAGTPRRYIVGANALGFSVLVPMMILFSPYRMKRILSYLDPWADASDTGYQIIQSFIAFQSGGWFGQGLGASKQKLFYLPAAHTDFIFSVIAEELGVFGSIVLIAAFFAIFLRGFQLARAITDPFTYLLASGLLTFLIVNVFMNLGVVTGLLPTKGLALPLLSAGGSSLISNLAGAGLLANIFSRHHHC